MTEEEYGTIIDDLREQHKEEMEKHEEDYNELQEENKKLKAAIMDIYDIARWNK